MRKLVAVGVLGCIAAFAFVAFAGPPPGKAQHGRCVKVCSLDARDARSVEQALHEANIEACFEDSLCLEAEDERHVAAIHDISATQKACKRECPKGGPNR